MPDLFEIEEIGAEVAANAGLPDGCDLCGHCRVMWLMANAGRRVAFACGGRGRAIDDSPLRVLRGSESSS